MIDLLSKLADEFEHVIVKLCAYERDTNYTIYTVNDGFYILKGF